MKIGAGFLPDATLRFEDQGGLPFVLLAPLMFASERLQRIFVVPAGFKTDLASVPRFLWHVIPPIGRYDAAAVVHDYLYANNGVSRAQADAVLNEAMRVLGVRASLRRTLYLGVRLGGWLPWRRYRRGEQ